MKNPTISRIIGRVMFVACFGSWATLVFMMLYLAQFNTPNLVDDFCFAWVSKEFGVLPGAYFYYMGWSGRYFGNIMMHLTPLFFSSSFTFSGINTYLLLALGFVTNLYLVRRMTDLPFRSTRLWSSVFLIQAAALYSISGMYQWFYWFSGIYYYASLQLVILFFVVYFFEKPSRVRTWILAGLLFCLMGSSEISMLLFSGVFWGYQLWKWRFKGPLNPELYLFLGIWLVGFLLVMLSPGNQVRAVTNVPLADGIHILLSNVKELIRQFFSSPFMWASFLWVLFVLELPKSYVRMSILDMLALTALFFISIIVSFIPLSFALGEVHIPERIISLFLLYMLMFVCFIVLQLKSVWGGLHLNRISVLVLVFIGLGIYKSKNFDLLSHEISTGSAKAYSQEYRARFEQIRLSKTDSVEVAPLKNHSALFFTEDLSTDPKHLWCKCVANYYGKKAVYRK
jgi:hypothetical protein